MMVFLQTGRPGVGPTTHRRTLAGGGGVRCVSSRWTRSDADPWICWLILQHPLPFGPEQVPNRLCSRRRRAQLRVHCWAHGCLPNRENVSAAQPMTSPPYPFSSPVEPTLCPFLSEPATLRGGAGTQATLDVHARRETTCCVARQGLTHTADHQLARRCSACGVASSNGRPTDVCVGGCRGPPLADPSRGTQPRGRPEHGQPPTV